MANTQGHFRSGPWRWYQILNTMLNAAAVRWSELNLESKPTCYFLITALFNMSFKIRKVYVQTSVTSLLLKKRTFWALLLAGGKVTTGLEKWAQNMAWDWHSFFSLFCTGVFQVGMWPQRVKSWLGQAPAVSWIQSPDTVPHQNLPGFAGFFEKPVTKKGFLCWSTQKFGWDITTPAPDFRQRYSKHISRSVASLMSRVLCQPFSQYQPLLLL